jgi:hypothetical protein
MNDWIKCSDSLPVLDHNAPKYAQRVRVIAGKPGYVGELTYARNAYAKTEAERIERWEESSGRPSLWTPTVWMPLPDAPGN